MPINSPDVFNVIGDAVVTGSGGGAVESVTGTAPISVSPTTGAVVVSLNTTGVVSHDTQPTLSADLDLNANAIVANNNVNDAKLEFFGNNVILSSATVGSIWDAYTAVNRFFINQPTGLGSPSSIASTDKLKIKSGNSTSAIKVDNASNTEVFNLEMDGAGSVELNMPDGKAVSKNLTLGASGTTYSFPTAVGSVGQVLKVGATGSSLEFDDESGGVTSVTGGDGVTASPTTGDVVLGETDTGVSAGTYTNATITVNAKGKVFSASSGASPVTSVGATAPISSTGGSTPTISLDDVTPDPSGAYTNPAIIVDSKGRVTAATSTIAVSNVTATSPIFSSGGTTPNITHGDSGVTADTYKKATITVNAKGHVTNATPGTDLITMRGETDTDWSARATWFVSQDWQAGIAKETGSTTVTLSSFDDWIRYPVINFNEQFDGKIEVEGYLLLGAGVPATKATYRISVWRATGTTGDTSETFTKIIESGNLTAGGSNALTVVPKTTLTYTASAGDYLMIGLTNISATVALSTGMCYANLNVRFQNS